MVRAVKATVLIGVTALVVGCHAPAPARPDPRDEEQLTVTTAYAYAPEAEPAARFDPRAARAALWAVDVSGCRQPAAATARGHARVTFEPTGKVSEVEVDATGGLPAPGVTCVAKALRTAAIGPFGPSPVTLGVSWVVPAGD